MNANERDLVIKHLVSLYLQQKNFEKANDIVKITLKKSKDKKKAWLDQLEFLIQWREHLRVHNEDYEEKEIEIKETLKRALQSLDKPDHIIFLSRYANLEYKFG